MSRKTLSMMLLSIMTFMILAGFCLSAGNHRNVIIVIVDGMGSAHRQLGELASKSGLAMNHMESFGLMATRSADLDITDSAAAATAMFCGSKTYNGMIGYDEDLNELESIMELARKKGMSSGIVTTSELYDATCAAMYAKEFDRTASPNIAGKMLKSGTDLLIGGGKRYVSKALSSASVAGKSRSDYSVSETLAEFAADRSLPKICLLAEDELPLVIDSPKDKRLLADMTKEALISLDRAGKPFILLVESGGADGASHDNDAAAVLSEIQAADEAVSACLSFVKEHGNTLVVVASDHETGGLSLGSGAGYRIGTSYLRSVTASASSIYVSALEKPDVLGSLLIGHAGLSAGDFDVGEIMGSADPAREIGRLISSKANISWGTSWHTAVPVTVTATGPGSSLYAGFYDNTGLFSRLVASLGLK